MDREEIRIVSEKKLEDGTYEYVIEMTDQLCAILTAYYGREDFGELFSKDFEKYINELLQERRNSPSIEEIINE